MGCEDSKVCKALESALIKTLEALAFVEVIPLREGKNLDSWGEEVIVHPRGEVVWSQIPLVRPTVGTLMVQMSPQLAHNLTEMIYGMLEDQEIPDEMMMDALAEMTNVLAGRFFNNLLKDASAFELGLPKMGRVEKEEDLPQLEEVVQSLDYAVEGHKLTVVLAGEDFGR